MIRIIGIDGLDINIIKRHFEILPNFKKLFETGVLNPIESVFPADSVPAWTTIFTGLNPAEHGIIRGIDYVESVSAFQEKHGFILQGKTFWDHLSEKGYKCLVINPFLAYPAWEINGIMESGPAFIEGDYSIFPMNADSLHPEILGGYSAISNLAGLKAEIEKVFFDTDLLWKEYEYQADKDNFDLEFVTFTTLDRVQHYTWRYYDPNDPLHEQDDFFSGCIPLLLKTFDEKLGAIMLKMNEGDSLVLVSDHGFRQRPYELINLNEYLRNKELLIVKKEYDKSSVRQIQRLKKKAILFLSHLRILDMIASRLRKYKSVGQLKKSDHLIDKENSVCYTDDLFSGKKPYVGLNFGEKIKASGSQGRMKAFGEISSVLNSGAIPRPIWIKRSEDLYSGKFQFRMPDVCLEFPPENGVEFNYFGPILEKSTTHYRISGGHFGSGTFGYFCRSNKEIQPPKTLLDFFRFINDLRYENSSGK
ncbi:MAG: alkaline phosphatase family protein [Bacteroidales bacterium]|nr:alkaline phosphatase family protein [Bacteroidales bacterium]